MRPAPWLVMLMASVVAPAAVVGCLLTNSLDGVSDGPPDHAPIPDVLLILPGADALFPIDDGAVRCGKLTGDPCCVGGLCGPGLACTADKCAPPVVDPCGDDGQKCCPPASSCKSGFGCRDGKTCQKSPDPPPPCGHATEICCGGGAPACVDGNTICDGAHCVSCGAGGQPCCGGGGCAGGGLICNGVTCIGCGGVGEPCCQPGNGCGAGAVCNGGGTCVACGGVLQPCCGGGLCAGSATCIVSTCKECCAKCSNRTEYHNVGATSDCTNAAKAYCATPASPTRGSFQDAMWGSCP